MEAKETEKELIHREFELERLILFSDAVFAIAITLLVIDIKFPELPENLKGVNYLELFRPTLFHFLALCISFFFIGMFWARHLALFRYLQKYNKSIIIRNLFFLFFIVVFPFAADGLAGHMRPNFMLPFFIYFTNIFLCALMHLLLCHYIFYKKPALSIAGHHDEKKYIYLRSLVAVIILGVTLLLAAVITLVAPGNTMALGVSFYIIPLAAVIARRRLKKFKPAEEII
jgi:uncharacterized membrane protein